MRDIHWSPAEKAFARKVFNKALAGELQEVIDKTKARAAKIDKPEELWKLEDWLTRRRIDIDRKYDYRYSVLLEVCVRLILEGRLTQDDLLGLGADKLEMIARWLKVSKEIF